MKVIQKLIRLVILSSPCLLVAAEPGDAPASKPAADAAAVQPAAAPDPAESRAAEPASAAAVAPVNGTNGLRMNFRGASLEMVLNYLSEAAGFIINVRPGTSVRGKVDIWSNETLTKEEALDLLDTVLIQNNLAAIRNGKVLSIVNRDEAKTQNVPVVQEADPTKIPSTDRIVTQIIPVRYVEVAQLVKDLQPLVSVQTTITANEAGNSLVITDTQANIKKVAEVVRAIDMGAEDVGLVKVFRLEHADPTETADLLTNLFPDDSRTGGTQGSQFGGRFGGFGRFFGGGGGGGGGFGNRGGGGGGNQGAGSNAQNQRLRKRNRVVAVADPRTASVVVTATRDLMDQIEAVIADLDSDGSSQQGIAVYHMQNAQPQEAMQVLQDIFNKNNQQNTRNNNTANQTSALTGRSNTQNQQNNNNTSRGTMTNQRGGGGTGFGGGFGQ